jgi:hypothetical protein
VEAAERNPRGFVVEPRGYRLLVNQPLAFAEKLAPVSRITGADSPRSERGCWGQPRSNHETAEETCPFL